MRPITNSRNLQYTVFAFIAFKPFACCVDFLEVCNVFFFVEVNYFVCSRNIRFFLYTNIRYVNRTFCHRITVEQEEYVSFVAHKRFNGELIIHPLSVYDTALSVVRYICIVIAVLFIQTKMMERTYIAYDIQSNYYVVIFCICAKSLRRREVERRTIVVVRNLQYAVFTFVAFKPFKVHSAFRSLLANYFKVCCFVKVHNFVRSDNVRLLFYADVCNIEATSRLPIRCLHINSCIARQLIVRPIRQERFNVKLVVYPFIIFLYCNLVLNCAFR